MKRFLIFLMVLCSVICSIYIPSLQYYAEDKDGTYYFYTTQNYESPISKTTKNGNGFIISCDIKKASIVQKALNKNLLVGESFVFKGDANDVVLLLNDMDILYKTNNDLDIIAYSPKIPYTICLNNQIFNIQISQNNNLVYVGFPAIFGSF